MVPELRNRFNAAFTPQKYAHFCEGMRKRSRTDVKFRLSETPLFLREPLVRKLALTGKELIEQLVNNSECLDAARATIPPKYRTPGEPPKPMFVQVDFGLIETGHGYEPRLVEIQAFPSLYAYQPALAEQYIESYGLGSSLEYLVELDPAAYRQSLRDLIVGIHDPENVVLLEIHPRQQKTLPDFVLTEDICGIRTVCVTQVEKIGDRLFYQVEGKRIPIHRIYNRAIFDELDRKQIELPFRFTDDLEVEWAGHPNWFYLISKFSLPYLRHPAVPRTYFLDQLKELPGDLENWVLKPLYSFAGLGVVVGVTQGDIDRIPLHQRQDYILQERVDFASTVDTPHGWTKAEIRMMYLWNKELVTGAMLVRMGRGKMMGVDHNRDMEWVGASAGLFQRA